MDTFLKKMLVFYYKFFRHKLIIKLNVTLNVDNTEIDSRNKYKMTNR